MKVLPSNVPELIAELEAAYPARCIKPEESPEAAHRYAGKVDLIVELRRRLNAETKRENGELPKVIRR